MKKSKLKSKLLSNPYRDIPFDDIPAAPVTIAEDEIGFKFSADVPESSQHRIYIVWTVGTYANGVRLLDIRAICTTQSKAITYSKMLRHDKQPHELWTRVIIEPRIANHLYAEKLREFMVNTGIM